MEILGRKKEPEARLLSSAMSMIDDNKQDEHKSNKRTI